MISEPVKKRITEAFSNLQSLSDYTRLFSALNKPGIPLKDTGVSSRILSHWKEKGILSSRIIIHKGWNKFGFGDYIWIKIVQELRAFGLPLKTIKKVKDYLSQTIDLAKLIDSLETFKEFNKRLAEDLKIADKKNTPFDPMLQPAFYTLIQNEKINPTILEFLITNSIIRSKDVGFDIYSDGEISEFLDEIQEEEEAEDIFEESHLYISITQFISEFLTDKAKEKFYVPYLLLTEKEVEVLRRVRQKDLEEIIIKFPKGSGKENIDIITNKKIKLSKEDDETICKILGLRNYQSVLIKNQGQDNLYVEKSHRKKF